jgi:hypothetical protein
MCQQENIAPCASVSSEPKIVLADLAARTTTDAMLPLAWWFGSQSCSEISGKRG